MRMPCGVLVWLGLKAHLRWCWHPGWAPRTATEKAVADTAQAEATVGSRILKGWCCYCLKIPTNGNRMGGHYQTIFGRQASSNSDSSLGEGNHSLPPARVWVRHPGGQGNSLCRRQQPPSLLLTVRHPGYSVNKVHPVTKVVAGAVTLSDSWHCSPSRPLWSPYILGLNGP